jgi:molybdate transport system permease protein
MVGGNIPGVTRTVAIAIYDHTQSFDYTGANRLALLLMAFSFITLSITYSLNRRVWAVSPTRRQ